MCASDASSGMVNFNSSANLKMKCTPKILKVSICKNGKWWGRSGELSTVMYAGSSDLQKKPSCSCLRLSWCSKIMACSSSSPSFLSSSFHAICVYFTDGISDRLQGCTSLQVSGLRTRCALQQKAAEVHHSKVFAWAGWFRELQV